MNQVPTILLVEDNPVDVVLMQRAFRQLDSPYRLTVTTDGAQAMQYLTGEAPYADREEYPFPSLILLDLGLPIVDGFQFMQWLRQQSSLRHVPVIVLSGSSFSPDVKRAYAAGANSFLTKPSGLTELTAEIKGLTDYWIGHCKLPDSPAPLMPGVMPGAQGKTLTPPSANASPAA